MHLTDSPRELPVWRSILFVPAVSDRFVDSALKGDADALQIDLEDSVGPAQKDEARGRVAAIADRFAQAGRDVTVRVNRPWRMLVRDLEATVRASVKAIAMPKVPDASFVRELAGVLADIERERGLPVGHTRVITMVEDAEGLAHLDAIAAAHPRVVGQIVGGEDLSVSLGSTVDDDAMYVPNVDNVRAARRAGVLPIGFIGSVADYRDVDAYRARIVRARRLGFEGAFCIHPTQVGICNASFAPDPADVASAREMVDAFEREVGAGRAAFAWKGRMVDLPVVDRARRLLARHAAIEGKRRGA
ncbi:MAG TPA: CoA ester lyase, partial [Burkholderiaceae bacterium]|nr:CoA ester lyase [Burkholderiaceae bacterium]